MRKNILLATVLVVVALGCGEPDFDRPDLLKAPRVLAIQADPPQPGFGTATTLRALVYQPPAKTDTAACVGQDTQPKYQWSWCPMPTSSDDGYACPMAQQDLDMLFAMLGVGAAPPLDLGTGETATLTNPFPAPLLYALCKGEISALSPAMPGGGDGVDAGATSLFGCRFSAGDDPKLDLANTRPLGFPVSILLKYTPPCGSPPQDKYGPTLTTVFTVFLPTDETVPPNQNPVVGAVYADPSAMGSASVRAREDGGAPDAQAGGSSEPVDAGASGAPDIDGGQAGQTYDGGDVLDGGASADGGEPVRDAAPAAPSATPPNGIKPLDACIFPRQKRVGLWIDLDLSQSEFLPRPATRDIIKADEKDYRLNHFEQLELAWFTEAGEYGGAHGRGGYRTGYEPSYNQTTRPETDEVAFADRGRTNALALPLKEDYQPDVSRIFVVVRDSRGGVTWTSGTVSMEIQP